MSVQKILILVITLFFIYACENTNDKQTIKQIAITLIANYADGKGNAPTIRNYEDAGIIGVNERNINQLNTFIQTLKKEDIDTEEELNAVLDSLGISLGSDIFGPIITIHGDNPLTLIKGETYTEPQVTAIDAHDGEVPVYCVGEVDTNRVGTYIVKHSAVDEAGNITTIDRVVYIVLPTSPPPTSPPLNPTFSIGGNAVGLTNTVILQNNNSDNLTLATNGSFTFNTLLPDMSTYNATVLSSPATQSCTLSNASGTISGANITNILLTCVNIPPPPPPPDVYFITISISPSSYPYFDVTFLNTVNSDSITTQASGTVPADMQFSIPLIGNENYTIDINEAFNSGGYCYFIDNYAYSISGTITNSDIVLNVTCPGP